MQSDITTQDRKSRLKIIRSIVATGRIDRQEVLAQELSKMGIETTQAMLSRDLRYLRISKVRNAQGRAVYALPREGQFRPIPTEEEVRASRWSLTLSRNIAVLHTPPGHAALSALSIDEAHSPYILGTVAGDDTVMVILAEGREKEGFADVKKIVDVK